MQLTALALSAHLTSGDAGSTDMKVLARLCGHAPHQSAGLLDRLTTSHTLATWQHCRETDEIFWHPPATHRSTARWAWITLIAVHG